MHESSPRESGTIKRNPFICRPQARPEKGSAEAINLLSETSRLAHMLKPEEHIYEFGAFRLNIKARLFLKARRPVQLNPKTFELLAILVQRSGRLIEKEELLRELWPDSFVEESNLTQNIYLLRKALGEDANGYVCIKTVPRHGYRFVAEVREVQEEQAEMVDEAHSASEPTAVEGEEREGTQEEALEAAPLPPPVDLSPALDTPQVLSPMPGWKLRAGLIALVIALSLAVALAFLWDSARIERRVTPSRSKAIAVLPFKTLGEESRTEMLGLGMADAIIIKMSKLQQVPVLPTSTIIKYTGREHDPLTTGRELGVDAVLDGTVQRSGDRIRVTVQLISLDDGRTLWSEVYDEQFTSIFSVQDVISEHVAEALKPDLSREEKAQLAKRYTDNTEAYEAYVRGLYFWNKRSQDGLARAIEYFQRAVERDPKFALAYAGLADAYGLVGYFGYDLLLFSEAHDKAKAAALRALELDETIAEAHTSMAMIKEVYEWDEAAAEKEHQRAIALNANSATAHLRYSVYLNEHGRHEEAFQEMHRARALDPLSAVVNSNLGFTLYYRGEYDQAADYCRKSIETEPDYVPPQIILGMIYEEKGMYTEAIAQLNRARSVARGHLYAQVLEGLGYTYAVMGRRDEAQKMLLELDRLAKENKLAQSCKISILARLGQTREAFKLLDEQVEGASSVPYWLRADPRYESLRTDPEYREFLQRHKFRV
ncbi:MAG TPA: winged helix-turn-helix domain-containing protein [Pyrinomonadaceae bacterium]|jgi:TolB-like protein/DNA-binding winged helix-turn-helix (wHTH) protein/Tfp pilus assembly protein PilF